MTLQDHLIDVTSKDSPIAITMGDPAGIGGEITLKAWQSLSPFILQDSMRPLFVLGDITYLDTLCKLIPSCAGIVLSEIHDPCEAFDVCRAGMLPVFNMPLATTNIVGHGNSENGPTVLKTIEKAVEFVLSQHACALTTNPIHKGILYDCGFRHPGHTEFLAALAMQALPNLSFPPLPVMMLATGGLTPPLRVVPVTIHIPLAHVIETLTQTRLFETALITAQSLQSHFGIQNPRLAIAGLNPHAGEQGAIGNEENDLIKPVIKALEEKGILVFGPLPADTMFHERARAEYDAALCMYHDQALIPIKTLAFDEGVNLTLGLPFIRTSPDHGTAFDIAGKGLAKADSLIAALKMAHQMADFRFKMRC